MSNSKKIWIYGAGEMGGVFLNRLLSKGYIIKGMLDKKKEGLYENTNIPIIRLDALSKSQVDTDDIVIIALADGMQHRTVIKELSLRFGFIYFIFLPLGFNIDSSKKRCLMNQYNSILEGTSESIGEIDEIETYLCPMIHLNSCVIDKNDAFLTVLVPWEILFTEKKKLCKGDVKKIHTLEEDEGISIATYEAYLQLFEYIDGKRNDCEALWNSFDTVYSDEKKYNELKARENLFRIYENEYMKGLDFFINSAPLAIWDENKFCLHGGHHRSLYLIYKGCQNIPVKISRTDYSMWVKNGALKQVQDYISSNDCIKTPIAHPAFFDVNSIYEHGIYSQLGCVARWIGKKIRSYYSLLEIGDMAGRFSFMFNRMNSAIECLYLGIEDEDVKLSKLSAKLYENNNISIDKYKGELNADKRFDIIVMNGVNAVTLDKEQIKEISEYANKIVIVELPLSEDIDYYDGFISINKMKLFSRTIDTKQYVTYGWIK